MNKLTSLGENERRSYPGRVLQANAAAARYPASAPPLYTADSFKEPELPRADVSLADEIPAVPPPGYVRLSEKASPVRQRPEGASQDATFCYLRGTVDVRPLQQLLKQKAATVWSRDYQATANVNLHRPYHDKLTVGAIFFAFCDDFVLKVYHFPWFNDPEWREVLEPIFSAIGVRRERVTRCLLARLPPGGTISQHYDIGPWVQISHRIHVPVHTNDRVVFRVGPKPSQLRRIRFDEGHLIELNNQAFHEVTNLGEHERIHLIFDYCEDDTPLQHVTCQPGEKLHQRRGIQIIDRAADAGSRPLPSWIILGAQKCGTTSVYEHLTEHPLSIPARKQETHFFDWNWPESTQPLDLDRLTAAYREHFEAELLHMHPSCMTGESTPSYLLNSHLVIDRVKRIAPAAKLIVMLRDPVERAWSQYAMLIDEEGAEEYKRARGHFEWQKTRIGFNELIEQEMRQLDELGIGPETPYKVFQERYLDLAGRYRHGGHSLLARGLYALQLEPWLATFPSEQLLVVRMEDLADQQLTQAVMERIFGHVGLPPYPLADRRPRNTRVHPALDEATRARLQAFFAPHNQRLYALLAHDFGWPGTASSGATQMVVSEKR